MASLPVVLLRQHDGRNRPGLRRPGDRLSPAESADRSPAALHQTPEEREQPAEGENGTVSRPKDQHGGF